MSASLEGRRQLMGGMDGVLREGVLRLLLFRHGESVVNLRPNIIGGRMSESPLTAKGVLQARALGAHLRATGVVFDYVFSSTAVRAAQTAEIALKECSSKETASIVQSEQLLEIDQGEWSGKSRPACMTPEVLARIRKDPWTFKAPKGESHRDVEHRMLKFIDGTILPLRRTHGSASTTVGIFSHGMAIRCLLRGILGSDPAMTWKLHMNNANITELWHDPVIGWRVMHVNYVPQQLISATPKL